MKTLPATESFAAFARRLRCHQSWVTQLRRDDRLVLTPDGRAVRVAESLARIDLTRDPAKDAVAARHAAARGAGAGEGADTPPAPADAPPAPASAPSSPSSPAATPTPPPDAPPPDDPTADEPDLEPGSSRFQYWREREQKAKALATERANDIANGKLMDATEVKAAVASAGTVLRTAFEQLPDTLGPQLVGLNDESRVRALMVEAVEIALAECSRKLTDLAKGATA